MLGAAFVLTGVSDVGAGAGAVGGALGVALIVATHAVTRLETLDLSRPDRDDPTAAPRLVALHALHACTEGIAIGVAMAVDPSLGVFMAIAIAVHNVPEAALLSSATRRQGAGRPRAVGLVVLSNVGQPALAVATWFVVAAAPASLPWVLGFAVGALLNLVMTELLPASYKEAGSSSIALVASVALGLVVLLGGILP
jgi:zinc transporter ZupT